METHDVLDLVEKSPRHPDAQLALDYAAGKTVYWPKGIPTFQQCRLIVLATHLEAHAYDTLTAGISYIGPSGTEYI